MFENATNATEGKWASGLLPEEREKALEVARKRVRGIVMPTDVSFGSVCAELIAARLTGLRWTAGWDNFVTGDLEGDVEVRWSMKPARSGLGRLIVRKRDFKNGKGDVPYILVVGSLEDLLNGGDFRCAGFLDDPRGIHRLPGARFLPGDPDDEQRCSDAWSVSESVLCSMDMLDAFLKTRKILGGEEPKSD